MRQLQFTAQLQFCRSNERAFLRAEHRVADYGKEEKRPQEHSAHQVSPASHSAPYRSTVLNEGLG